jgi:FkbM family methyltransferase
MRRRARYLALGVNLDRIAARVMEDTSASERSVLMILERMNHNGGFSRYHAAASFRGILAEARSGWKRTAGPRDFGRYFADILLYRVLSVRSLPGSGRERRIRLRDGVEITYRLNRGDLQAIREVWLDETYRLPVDLDRVHTLIDLGANIGLASLYLSRRYGCSKVLAVEPDSANARLALVNLRRNGIFAEVLHAAVAPSDGVVYFQEDEGNSLLGRLSETGRPVRAVSMCSLLDRVGGAADLVKLDIEGGEGPLLNGDRTWLQGVHALLVEFHPTRVDYPGLVALLRNEGYQYVPAGSIYPKSADTFVRDIEA